MGLLERRVKADTLDEIREEMLRAWPSTSATDEAAKSDCLFELFGTRSWAAVEAMRLEVLRPALEILKAKVASLDGEGVPQVEPEKTPEDR